MIRANVWPHFGWTYENPKALSTCELEPQGIGIQTHSLRLADAHILHMLMCPRLGTSTCSL